MAIFQNLTIRQIAERSNVSIATVSRALNGTGTVRESTMQRIQDTINELGCEHSLNISLTKPKTRRLLASFPDLINPFNSKVIQGILDASFRRNYEVIFYANKNYNHLTSYDSFLKTGDFYDGMIIAHNLPDQKLIPQLNEKCPVVMCSEHISDAAIPYVAIDDYAAACTAVNHLISTGHRKIAFINSSLTNNYAIHRERGYRDCMQKAGLPINEKWVMHLPDVSYDVAIGSVAALFEPESFPDACFCVSDVFAASVIKLAVDRGISVPGDLSVIGFDDIDLATMTTPAITTIHQPAYQLGWQACNLLIEQLENPSESVRRIILNTDLIVRDSTAYLGNGE